MIFKTPWMLYLLLILPVFGKIEVRSQRLKAEAAAKLRGEKKVSNVWKKRIVLQLGALAALIFALAQPAWNPHPGPAGMQGRDLVIALDISRSMLAADAFPTRLDAAKIAVFESLDHLRGQRIGLITFAGAASVRVPLTLDHNFVRYMLERVQPSDADVGSTSIQSAIEKAIDVALKESKNGEQDLIILTDGEDLISNIDKTADELRECGARVLIVGLGDPVTGTRIPDIGNTNAWMQYKGSDVVTRLDEGKINQLVANSPNVTYLSAQTRPFDLTASYRKMLTDTANIPSSEAGQTVYTEGYPFLLAVALLLWILPMNRKLLPLLAAFLIAGCSPHFQPLEKEFTKQMDQGRTLWANAQTQTNADPRAALSTLTDAREAFLKAALLKPGNQPAAQQIAGVSAQIHSVERSIQEQEKAEEDLQKKLQAAIEELKVLTQRENALSQQSQQILRKRPPVTQEEKETAAVKSLGEQRDVQIGTGRVCSTLTDVQSVIRKMLKTMYRDQENPPTEFDEAINKLTAADESQASAVQMLAPDALNWPSANSSLLTATRRMQEALGLLADQNSGNNPDQSDQDSDQSDWDFDENSEWENSDQNSNRSMPMSSQNFKTALENRALPAPNYTAEDILTEEAANMEQRAQQKASRAGANVEKNW